MVSACSITRGEEERFLKSLFTNYCNGLLLLRDDLLIDGKPLVTFPRIWVLALSKSDLLPEIDVDEFRELLVEKAGDDIEKLRDVLAGMLDSKDALSVGEDFVILSSAKFEANKIGLGTRVGLDLVLPLASAFAFERHLRWAKAGQISRKVAVTLLRNAEVVAVGLGIAGGVVAKLGGVRSKAVATVVFANVEGRSSACLRVGDRVALRFPDPLTRTDLAGRVIPHDFVVFPPLADQVHSVEDGLQLVWARHDVAALYERVWNLPTPPAGR